MKQLHEYETPLTDEAEIDNSHFADYGSGPSGYVVGEFARGLERKLAMCRDALEACHIALPDGDDTAWNALAATEPKQ